MERFQERIVEIIGVDSLADVATHGIGSGFSELVYYRQSGEFYDQWEDEILEHIDQKDLGTDDSRLSSFTEDGSLKTLDQIKSDRVFVAVDSVCYELTHRNNFFTSVDLERKLNLDWDDLVNHYLLIWLEDLTTGDSLELFKERCTSDLSSPERVQLVNEMVKEINDLIPDPYSEWLWLVVDHTEDDYTNDSGVDIYWEIR